MRRETTRRYRSVEQFSEDIRRHLAGRPVIARPDTLSYRGSKFVRRNKVAISAAFLIVLSLVGGMIATAWQARRATIQEQRARAEQARAERRFNDVRKLANRVLFDYHDAIRNLPGAAKVRELLVKDGLEYLDSLAGEAHGDPALQRELAAAYEKVGEVRAGLGDMPGSLESHGKALTIREAIAVAQGRDAQARRDLASSHKRLGDQLLDSDQPSLGLEHLQNALTLFNGLTQEQPGSAELQLELSDTSVKIGRGKERRGDLAGAMEQYRLALTIGERLFGTDPKDERFRRALWVGHERIAKVLRLQNDTPGSIEAQSKAVALAEELLAQHPLNTVYRRAVAQNYKTAADYRWSSDPQGALEYYRKALTLEEEWAAADPAHAGTLKNLAFTHKRVAELLANAQDNSAALFHFTKAREISEKVAADAPADVRMRFQVASYSAGIAGMQARLGHVEAALEECAKAIALLDKISEDQTNADHRIMRAEVYEYLGYAYVALAESTTVAAGDIKQHMSAARDQFQKSLNVLDDLRSRGSLDPANDNWTKEIVGEVAKCDAALGK